MESKARKSTAEIYQVVTKARPELGATKPFSAIGIGEFQMRLQTIRADNRDRFFWVDETTGRKWKHVPDDEAESLIESKWLRGLPPRGGVFRRANGEKWRTETYEKIDDVDCVVGDWYDTPIEALAEYFSPGSTSSV